MTAGLAMAFLELDWGTAIALGTDSIMAHIPWRRQEWDQR
jgi:hypothetical protein